MTTQPQLQKLFEPIRIGQMSLKNRIVMPPMVTGYGGADGSVTEQIKDYYGERARGGAGLIIVEFSCADAPTGRILSHQLVIDDDRFIPGLAELAQAIHNGGAKAAIQIGHGGRQAKSSITGVHPVAPSPIPAPDGETPRELTFDEIKEIVAKFAAAAERAKKAGFDAIEVHGAHGYLISEFLSPAANKRQDEYGGELKNRASLLLETLVSIRERVGDDYPVWYRVSAREYGVEGGIRVEETQEVAQMVQDAGADAIHVSAHGTGHRGPPPMSHPKGNLLRLAETIKKVVTVPLIAVGRIDPELGEEVLKDERADLIAIGRALIADPELPNKAASGRMEEVTPCIACNTCLDNVVTNNEAMQCAVNAALGRESEYRIQPARKPKKVLVVGGGPAGMETARVAALRRHDVILYEKESRLGGQLLLGAVPPHKSGIETLNNYLTTQMGRLGVKVELGKEVDPALVQAINPDTVVIATGVTPLIPQIPGIDRENVVTATAMLADKKEVGERVVVIGGELVGCETAELLADMGKKVTVARRGPEMATKVAPAVRELLLNRLTEKGVTMLTGVSYEEITQEGLVIADQEGKKQTLEADTIVLAAGARPNIELYKALEGKVPQIHLAGDCVEPGRILEAIHDGSRIAREV